MTLLWIVVVTFVSVVAIMLVYHQTTKRKSDHEPFTTVSTGANPKQIQLLLRGASHWAITAERNPNRQEALRQSSYAMGYLYALQDLAPVEELDRHIDFPDFRKRVTDIHDQLVRQQ
jgi:hypothetical protein